MKYLCFESGQKKNSFQNLNRTENVGIMRTVYFDVKGVKE